MSTRQLADQSWTNGVAAARGRVACSGCIEGPTSSVKPRRAPWTVLGGALGARYCNITHGKLRGMHSRCAVEVPMLYEVST
jgi:hypothetical protein